MKIKEILRNAFEILKNNGIEDYTIIAKELLMYVLNKSNTYLIINQEETISQEICNKYNKLLKEIIEGKPIQYITNNQEFMKINFFVNENVLIPQPDTEILVEKVLEIVQRNYINEVKILDLCTGSGAIAISLDKNIENKQIYASDISDSAINIAKNNAKNNNSNIVFIKSDLFENIQNYKFDIIVSNPPYIKTKDIKNLSKQVQNEPNIALDGGDDGLYFYKTIAKHAANNMNKSGFLCLEIGFDQAEQVIEILKKEKNYKNIEVIKDLSGNNRCIISQKE